MEYPEAVVRQLRDRLARYHSETRINGRKRSWERVAEDMLDAKSTPPAFVSAELYGPLGEALRRFAAGKQVLTAERLDVLRNFLIERGLVVETQTGIPTQTVRGLHALFAVDEARGDNARKIFEGSFIAVRERADRQCELVVLRIAQNSDAGLALEEEAHIVGSVPSPYELRDLDRFLQIRRRATIRQDGWLLLTAKGQVLVLLQDRLSGEAAFCSIVSWDVGNRSGASFFVFLSQPSLQSSTEIPDALRWAKSPEKLEEGLKLWLASGTRHFKRMAA